MVSQQGFTFTPNPPPNMLHHFMVSDSINGENQFQNQHFEAYDQSSLRPSSNSNVMFQSPGNLPIVTGGPDIAHTNYQNQRSLSLSLGSTMLLPCVSNYQNYLLPGREDGEVFPPASCSFQGGSFNNPSAYGFEVPAFGNVIRESRFLSPTKSLLQEMVSVDGNNGGERLYLEGKTGFLRLSCELKAEFCCNEMLPAEKQELRLRIVKLISMLEEVEERYEKYCCQMEQVVSSFEAVAGLGAAKCYTEMALQAMSRHFAKLRDSILSRIDHNRRKLAGGGCGNNFNKNLRLSQLSLRDGEARVGRRFSLHQLGLIQSTKQAWRPIRGLPETSAAILRAWLFEHFLHPYPTDSEKLMLSSQTGLTKNQVSNWFINARVRLWKPMIEEMYKEEFGDSPEECNRSPPAGSSYLAGEGNTDEAEED